MVRPVALAGFVVLFPTIAQAQGRAMMPVVSHSMAAAPRNVIARGPQPVATQSMQAGTSVVIRIPATRSSNPSGVIRTISRPSNPTPQITTDSMDFTGDFIPVPGLGFDIPHLAATRGPEAVGAGTRRRGFTFFPFFAGGFFQPVSPVIVVVEPPAPPEQQPERAPSETSDERRPQAKEPAPVSPSESAPAPQPEEEQFVFVRRDGKLLFAVAYAWENGVLRYITGEGLRRSVAKDALDLDATQQFNEQRGLNFRSPT